MNITKDNFETEVLNSPIPVVLDFWAPWCGPCRMLAPVLDELATEYAGRVKIGKINVDAEGALAEQHNVASIPCLVVYKQGKPLNRQVGAVPKTSVEALFKELL